ncbi:hypothetical protein [Rubritalea profundi]|uniref:Uncharacterized protein n=1 Tax=Rubritalea profundi TaxID=1658618 RepID=A0A2S7U5E4_9BACT|nr:hypothetical protein [Rubritalea profundi]PQJ29661.1 hypothetical protein BSZ32_14965 [Rubritalea profundi]
MSSLSLQDQALREIGKTIYNYQKLEKLLKTLIVHTNVFTIDGNAQEVFDDLRKSHSMQTLGNLVTRLFDTLYAPSKESPKHRGDSTFSLQIRTVFATEEGLEAHKEKLQSILLSRNTLIHQTLGDLDIHSPEACEALIKDLEAQNKAFTPVYMEFADTLAEFSDWARTIAENPDSHFANEQPTDDPEVIATKITHKSPRK